MAQSSMRKLWNLHEKALPIVMAAGKAGGTTIVIKSKASKAMSEAVDVPSMI